MHYFTIEINFHYVFSRMTVCASTWYRDSHGLFDYEEKEKLTLSNFKMKNNCKSSFRVTF
jgi:hypothetical protein